MQFFSKRKSLTWHINSQKRECDPATWTWRPLWSVYCLKCMQRCVPSLVLLAITGDLLRGHMHCTATCQTFGWRMSHQVISARVAFRGCPKGFWSIETGMYDSSSVGFCWLHQTIFVRDWCIQVWIRGSAVTEARGWAIPSCHLWQQGPHASWEELSID